MLKIFDLEEGFMDSIPSLLQAKDSAIRGEAELQNQY